MHLRLFVHAAAADVYAPIWNATRDLGSCSYDAELSR